MVSRNRLLAAGAAATGPALATLGYLTVTRRPAAPPDSEFLVAAPPVPTPAPPGTLRAVFAGVSTVALTDGATTLIVDGFFSRPPAAKVLLGRIAPDQAAIADGLRRMGVTTAAAVIVTHSHYDHALDAPEVARRTGAALVGSASTLMLGRGAGLQAGQLHQVEPGTAVTYGAFEVRCIATEHSPKPAWPGPITVPVRPPSRAAAYRMGECFIVHVTHMAADGRRRRLLVQASAGYRVGSLLDHPAEVAFLGIPTLGRQSPEYRAAYWRETVTLPGVRRVLPVHWDDFTDGRSADAELRPLPSLFDDLAVTREFLASRRAADGVEFAFPRRWQPFDPFAGL